MKHTDLGQVPADFAAETPATPAAQTDLHWLAADIGLEALKKCGADGVKWLGLLS